MDPKARILARRSAFVAAVLVTACEPQEPKVCLSIARPEEVDSGVTTPAPDAAAPSPTPPTK